MSDFLANLAAQVLSLAPVVQPLLPPRYAAMPAIASVGTLDGLRAGEPAPAPGENLSGQERADLPPPLVQPGDYDATYHPFSFTRIQQVAAPWSTLSEPAIDHATDAEAAARAMRRGPAEPAALPDARDSGTPNDDGHPKPAPHETPTRVEAALTLADRPIENTPVAPLPAETTTQLPANPPVAVGDILLESVHRTQPDASPDSPPEAQHQPSPVSDPTAAFMPSLAAASSAPARATQDAQAQPPPSAAERGLPPATVPASLPFEVHVATETLATVPAVESQDVVTPVPAGPLVADVVAPATAVGPSKTAPLAHARLSQQPTSAHSAALDSKASSQDGPRQGAGIAHETRSERATPEPEAFALPTKALVQQEPAASGRALPPGEPALAPAATLPALERDHPGAPAADPFGPRAAATPVVAAVAPGFVSVSADQSAETLDMPAIDQRPPASTVQKPPSADAFAAIAGTTPLIEAAAPATRLSETDVLAPAAVQPVPLERALPSRSVAAKPVETAGGGSPWIDGDAIQATQPGSPQASQLPPASTEAATPLAGIANTSPPTAAVTIQPPVAGETHRPSRFVSSSQPSPVDQPAPRQPSPSLDATRRAAAPDHPQAQPGAIQPLPPAGAPPTAAATSSARSVQMRVADAARNPGSIPAQPASIQPGAGRTGRVRASDPNPPAVRWSPSVSTPPQAPEGDRLTAQSATQSASTVADSVVRPVIRGGTESLANPRRTDGNHAKGEPAPLPTIRVTIGRIEVRSSTPVQHTTPGPAPRPRPALSLDDYLKQPMKVRP